MTRVNKRQARALYNMGRPIVAIPYKMNPDNQYFAMGAVLEKTLNNDNDFDKLCDQLSYYNCTNKTGGYLAFYIE